MKAINSNEQNGNTQSVISNIIKCWFGLPLVYYITFLRLESNQFIGTTFLVSVLCLLTSLLLKHIILNVIYLLAKKIMHISILNYKKTNGKKEDHADNISHKNKLKILVWFHVYEIFMWHSFTTLTIFFLLFQVFSMKWEETSEENFKI